MIKDMILGGVAAFFRGEKILGSPLNIQVEPTTYCNQNCKMCIRGSKNTVPRHMEENLLHLIVKKLSPGRIVFTGAGEPLLNPALPEMIGYCVKSRIKTMVSTNLTADGECIGKLLKSGIHLIKVSLDAPDRETYAAVRGEAACFDRVVNNIGLLEKNKPAGTGITLETLIMKDNYEKIPDMVELAGSLNVHRLCFRELQTEGLGEARRNQLVDQFDFTRLKKMLIQAEAKAKTLRIKTNIAEILLRFNEIVDIYSRAVPAGKGASCLLPWLQIFVAVNGDVSPCSALYANSGIASGNIAENSRDEILNGAAIACIRRGFRNGKIAPVCRDCIPRDFRRLLSLTRYTPGYIR
jgi:MoaA/NifB/PqqE/SkfB family radical SAM enzyme